jgi:hypothetical protein
LSTRNGGGHRDQGDRDDQARSQNALPHRLLTTRSKGLAPLAALFHTSVSWRSCLYSYRCCRPGDHGPRAFPHFNRRVTTRQPKMNGAPRTRELCALTAAIRAVDVPLASPVAAPVSWRSRDE